jgi:hypothetical protein
MRATGSPHRFGHGLPLEKADKQGFPMKGKETDKALLPEQASSALLPKGERAGTILLVEEAPGKSPRLDRQGTGRIFP